MLATIRYPVKFFYYVERLTNYQSIPIIIMIKNRGSKCVKNEQ